MNETAANSTGSQPEGNYQPQPAKSKAARRKGARQDLTILISRAEKLRTALRNTLAETNEILKGLKLYHRQNRALRQTIDSLRQLKALSA